MSEFGRLWKHEKTQVALYNYFMLGSATLLQMAFFAESDPTFSWENSHWVYKVYKIQIQKNKSTFFFLKAANSRNKCMFSDRSISRTGSFWFCTCMLCLLFHMYLQKYLPISLFLVLCIIFWFIYPLSNYLFMYASVCLSVCLYYFLNLHQLHENYLLICCCCCYGLFRFTIQLIYLNTIKCIKKESLSEYYNCFGGWELKRKLKKKKLIW